MAAEAQTESPRTGVRVDITLRFARAYGQFFVRRRQVYLSFGRMQTRLAMGEGKRAPESLAVVTSKLPKWNSRSQTYELPFSGRANFASARNFQLVEHAAMQRERVVLPYGKIEEDEFALDFACPLSLLHAFSICITTFAW